MDSKFTKRFEKIEIILSKIIANMATKADLKVFATKEDLKKFSTKDDLRNFATKKDLKKFATRDDLKNFATKDDLKGLPTRDDLKSELNKAKNELLMRIDDVDNGIAILSESTDVHKADRKELVLLRKRVEKPERKVFSN